MIMSWNMGKTIRANCPGIVGIDMNAAKEAFSELCPILILMLDKFILLIRLLSILCIMAYLKIFQ